MNETMKEKLECMIEETIKNELNRDTNAITNEGYNFLNCEAPDLVMKKIEEEDLGLEDLELLTIYDIENYLNSVIDDYHEFHNNIREN